MPAPPDAMQRLSEVLDRLIPEEAPWPGAGSLGIGEAVLADAEIDGQRGLVEAVLAALPTGFETAAPDAQVRALRAVEAEHETAFAATLRHACNVYYSHADVRAVLEAVTGYPARPPLYGGYQLPPFEADALAVQRERPAFWRRTT